jgi:23S rRNA (adenine2030-N6)-methyltransferase
LHQLFASNKQVSANKEDGLASLEKKLPPIQKRGLILIDPSYEVKAEYNQLVKTIAAAHRRFATGIYGLWYPVIDRTNTERMLQRLAETGIPKQLRIEHCVTEDSSVRGMTGSGMLFINPPWQLEQQAQILLPWLNQHLTDGKGHWKIDWQVPEN